MLSQSATVIESAFPATFFFLENAFTSEFFIYIITTQHNKSLKSQHIIDIVLHSQASDNHHPYIRYHHVQNDEVRRTTGQPCLSAIVQAWRLSLFGHIARMPDEADARSIITASPSENWRRPPGRPNTTWMKTIQQDLRSNNLSLDEAITVAQNLSTPSKTAPAK